MNSNSPTSPERPDSFDAFLRESDAHVPDDGFTRRVLAALPPRRRFEWVRLVFFAAAWLAGAVILLVHAPVLSGALTAFLEHARHGEVAALLVLAPALFVMGSLLWALACWALEEWV